MRDERYLVVLEADWSEDGDSDRVKRGRPVGPDVTYRDVFEGAAKTFGVTVDRAGFASESGFSVLARRFFSKPDAPYLIVGGHGSARGGLHPPAGSFNPWKTLENESDGCKEGLIFAACQLGLFRAPAERALRSEMFRWIGGYRTASYHLSAVLIELCFWRAFFDGWRYKRAHDGQRYRIIASGQDPIEAALLTYFEIAAAVGCRFDVRQLHEGEVISSLEIFSHIIGEGNGMLDLHGAGGLDGIRPSSASKAAASRYLDLAQRVWRNQWEWEVDA